MRKGFVFGTLVLVACGGEEQQVPPPVTPTPTVTATATAPEPVATTPPAPAPKPPMADMQRDAMKNAGEGLNGHDAKKFAGVYADDAVISVAGLNDVAGRAQVESNMEEWFKTFSKIKLGFNRVWMKDKTVVLEWVINGTHSGELFGVKGTENQIGHYGLSIVSFDDDGKVKTERRYGDLGTVATQLGATKEKARAIPAIPDSTDVITSKGADDAKSEEVAKAVLAAYDKKADADYEKLLADTVEVDGLLHLNTVKGKADAKKAFGAFFKAFPDAKITPGLVVGVGDSAVVEYTMTGTNKGAIGSVQPTKKPVTVHAVDVFKIKDGKVARVWSYQNSTEMMTQLGLFKVDVVKGGDAKGPAPKGGDAKSPAPKGPAPKK